MSARPVGDRAISPEQDPKVVRVAAEVAFGEQLRADIAKSGAKFVDVARVIGIRREDLYEVLDGQKHMRAAWLPLLPPAVERIYLERRAAALGFALAPVADADDPRGRVHVVVKELSDVMAAATLAEADDEHTVEEAMAERREIEEAQRALAARDAHLVSVIEKRGVRVVRGRP